MQDSVNELGTQLVKHPSITPNDFDISQEGKLLVKVSPPVVDFRPFDKTPIDLNLKKKPVPSARTSAGSPPISSSTKAINQTWIYF
jgi:hypothetical protein